MSRLWAVTCMIFVFGISTGPVLLQVVDRASLRQEAREAILTSHLAKALLHSKGIGQEGLGVHQNLTNDLEMPVGWKARGAEGASNAAGAGSGGLLPLPLPTSPGKLSRQDAGASKSTYVSQSQKCVVDPDNTREEAISSEIKIKNSSQVESEEEYIARWTSIDRTEEIYKHATGLPAAETPKIFHFTWVSSNLGGRCHIPRFAVKSMVAWEVMHKDWKIVLWTDPMLRHRFSNLSGSLLENIREPAWISDIVRFKILAEFGGLYADVDTLPLKSLTRLVVQYSPFAVCVGNAKMNRTDLIIPYESMPRCKREQDAVMHSWTQVVANGLVAAPRDNFLIKKMYERVVEKAQIMVPKQDLAFTTTMAGPAVWTRILRIHKRGLDGNFTILNGNSFFPCDWRFLNRCTLKDIKGRNETIYTMHMWRGSWK